MKLGRHKAISRKPQGLPVILFLVGEYVFAIAASAVAEIQALQDRPEHSHETNGCTSLCRDGKRYWVVDAKLHFELAPTRSTRVLLLSSLPVALQVDSIIQMAELTAIMPLPRTFQGREKDWYSGLAVVDDRVVPLVNPASFLTPARLEQLEASLSPALRVELQTAEAAL